MAAEDANRLSDLVTPGLLRRLAGDRFFGRGEIYFRKGAVRSLRRDGGGAKAVVQGTHRYRVRFWIEDDELGFDCTCPVGRDGAFCKHCVAVGLAWHSAMQDDDAGVGEDAETIFEEVDLRAYLRALDKEDLVSLLVDRADEDERLHRRLALRAAQAAPESGDLSVWKDALDEALSTGDFVDYQDAYDYAAGVEDVIESLHDLLQAGEPDRVIQLAEHGLAEVEESLEHIDDSDGWMGGHLDRLQELHLEACRQARPDPVDLAERLFEGEMESSFGTFGGAFDVYADVLGEAGRAAYRRLAEAEWVKIPALKPGEVDPNRFGTRYQITSIMEALSEASGDLEALIAVKSRDLSSPHAFLEIANLYQGAGDSDRALDWAERGWKAFSGTHRDERLRAFIADAYQSRGSQDDAMALIWEAFVDSPYLETYLELQRHGRCAGQWPEWRERALAEIRKRIGGKTAPSSGQRSWMRSPLSDHSLLVEVFLHEGDPEAAWREAGAGGCSQDLWLELANRREKTHPDESIKIYQAHIAALLRNTGDHVYQEAVGYLEKIEALLLGCGREAAFQTLLDEIRATHKRKRNLMKMLDRKGW